MPRSKAPCGPLPSFETEHVLIQGSLKATNFLMVLLLYHQRSAGCKPKTFQQLLRIGPLIPVASSFLW